MSTTTKKSGQIEARGPLYDLLLEAFPAYRSHLGLLDVHALAKDLGYSHEWLYQRLRADRLNPDHATKIVELSKGRLDLKDLLTFVFA